MNEQIQTKAIELLERLAIQLGVATEHLWEVLTRQAYVGGTQLAIFSVLTIYGGYRLHRLGGFCREKYNKDHYSDWDIGMLAAYTGCGVVILIGILCLLHSIGMFINPEYEAVKTIISLTN